MWITIELIFTLGQIIAAITVLFISRQEKRETPLLAWVVGYAAGCAASLPLLYWYYLHHNRGTAEQRSSQLLQNSSQGNSTTEPTSYITISLTRSSDEEDGCNISTVTLNGPTIGSPNARFSALVYDFKMALDCLFAVWFVVGNVWIFGRIHLLLMLPICIGYVWCYLPLAVLDMLCLSFFVQ